MKIIDELLDKIDIKNLRKIILFLSISTFIISLTQKCYCTDECGDSIMVLILGFFGIISGLVGLTWYANPLLLLSWCTINDNKYSTIFSIISFVLSFSFLLFDEIMDDEAGHYSKIVSYELGYWLWLLSTAIMVFGNLLIGRKLKKDPIKDFIKLLKIKYFAD